MLRIVPVNSKILAQWTKGIWLTLDKSVSMEHTQARPFSLEWMFLLLFHIVNLMVYLFSEVGVWWRIEEFLVVYMTYRPTQVRIFILHIHQVIFSPNFLVSWGGASSPGLTTTSFRVLVQIVSSRSFHLFCKISGLTSSKSKILCCVIYFQACQCSG